MRTKRICSRASGAKGIHFGRCFAEPLYLTKYIERMGTGTGDMIAHCRRAGLPAPVFALADGFVVTLRRKPQLAFETVGGQSEEPSRNQEGTRSGLSRDQVEILHKCIESQSITDLMEIAGRTNRTKFRDQVLKPLLEEGLLIMTIPDKPTSSIQKYRLTEKGNAVLTNLQKKDVNK
ncbi:MAG: hypothetical protein WA096_11130 [Smithella sp.]